MPFPISITFRGMPSSPAVEANIRERAEKLTRFGARILSCHVVVDAPHRHKTKGEQYAVHVQLKLPHHEVAVSRENHAPLEHEDLYVAIRDAFDAARRRLEDRTRRVRGKVKLHREPTVGHVVHVSPLEGYGFVETFEGLEIYFHANAIVGAKIDQLHPGSEVRLSWVEGPHGPRASTLELVGKHHVVPALRSESQRV